PDIVAPGVYVEETGAGAHVIAGVPTSVAAFVGATASGPVAVPRIVHSFAEFEAQFGALAAELPLGYAVQQYFVNGGRDALTARIVPSGPTLTDADLSSPALEAQKRGLWLLDHAERFNILCIPPLARTDASRGVWKAPAGAQANVLGVAGLSATLSDAQLSALNAMGVNGLRALSGAGV